MNPEEAYQAGMMDAQRQLTGQNIHLAGDEAEAKDLLRITLDYEKELRDIELSLRGQAEVISEGQIKVLQVSDPVMNNKGIQTLLDVIRLRTKAAILTDMTKTQVENHIQKTIVEVYVAVWSNTKTWEVDISRRELVCWNIVEVVAMMMRRGVLGKERQAIYKRTTASEVYHKSDTQFSGGNKGLMGRIFGG